MSAMPYDPVVYRQFAENLAAALKGGNIEHPSMRELKKKAMATARFTKNGSPVWYSKISSRMAAKTVYLGGGPEIVVPRASKVQLEIVEKAPEQLHKVLQLLKTMPFVHIRRQMCENKEFNPICNLYVCVADPKNYRLAFGWATTMGEVKKNCPGPEFTMIDIPEEHMMRLQILTIPEHDINIALGSDYTGECKKGFLRQAMFRADQRGMLGLHAGTKIVKARDRSTGKLKKYGVFMFGLTATGKSTWSCHQLGLDPDEGEGTFVAQDDIVILKKDGSALGTEQNYYVKTDVDEKLQEAMYHSLIHKSALLENVMIDGEGNINFLDERLGENGRGILNRFELKVKRGGKLVSICADSLNIPTLEELDGLVFAFITRRNTMMPFAQRLNWEQGVLAYLWGESTHSFATVPEKAGESVRIVGMDDFIIGNQGRKVNVFYDIIKDLVGRYPGKVHFFQYNTGGMGEIINIDKATGKKTLIRKAKRVPIDIMASLQRGDLRGTNSYRECVLKTEEVWATDGIALTEWDPKNYYSEEEIKRYAHELVEGRRAFTEEIAAQGLRKEIREMAHKELDRIEGRQNNAGWAPVEKEKERDAAEDRLPLSPYISPWKPGRNSKTNF
jgi:phosphoenolpyruvate carboxykinase (ATP)